MKSMKMLAVCAAATTMMFVEPVAAQTITNGFTFSVASGGGAPATGTHFHSSTGGVYGNPAGKAEVGHFSTETVRGLSEYNLTGLTTSPTAFVTFDIFKKGGLFTGTNDTPFTGPITIYAYQGNNAEDISDYQAPAFATIGTFTVDPTVNNVGDIFSFDISSAFNSAITSGFSSLGIRLQADPAITASQAWTFENFRLTSNNQTTGGPTGSVPEATTWAMMIVGSGMIGLMLRRRRDVSVRVAFAAA